MRYPQSSAVEILLVGIAIPSSPVRTLLGRHIAECLRESRNRCQTCASSDSMTRSIRRKEAVGTEITFSSSACFRRPRLLSRDLEIEAWHKAQIPTSVDGGFQDGYRIRMICAPPSDIRRRCAMLGQRPPCSHRTWASYSGLSGAGSSW